MKKSLKFFTLMEKIKMIPGIILIGVIRPSIFRDLFNKDGKKMTKIPV